jgi:NAD(P)-dependent dehydrogenase (short-subunit alcohol dehydrogenase family)
MLVMQAQTIQSLMNFLITGASTGIGEGCARWLDVRGHHVFAGVRRDEDAARLKAGSSSRLTPLLLDVTVEASIRASVVQVRSILEKTGGDELLDGLVNNAGIAVAGPLEYTPLDAFRRQFEVNVTGQIAVTQAYLPVLRRARGRIVFVGSIGGLWATPFLAPYCASKFALEAIADCLRLELQPWGIHVSILEPGSIATPIWRKPGDGGVPADAPLGAAIDRDYGSALRAFRDILAVSAKRGGSTDRTSVVIEHALTAPTPRTRYVVGREAKVQAAIRKLLPDRLRDRLVTRAMKLPARTRQVGEA